MLSLLVGLLAGLAAVASGGTGIADPAAGETAVEWQRTSTARGTVPKPVTTRTRRVRIQYGVGVCGNPRLVRTNVQRRERTIAGPGARVRRGGRR